MLLVSLTSLPKDGSRRGLDLRGVNGAVRLACCSRFPFLCFAHVFLVVALSDPYIDLDLVLYDTRLLHSGSYTWLAGM